MLRMSLGIRVAGILLAAFFSSTPIQAQNGPGGSLAEQLRGNYKFAKLGMDSSGTSVVQDGTVLTIQKGGILGVPPASVVIPAATYKDGDLKGPGGFMKAAAGTNTKLLPVGDKVYVLKIDVNIKTDKVVVTIVECDQCNGTNEPSSYKSQVAFQFPKDYLTQADAGQVQDMISQVLAPESAEADQQQQGQDAAPPQDAGNNDQGQPPPVQVGDTIGQVIRVMGMPKHIENVGNGQVYVYNEWKVTIVRGRVADIQQ